MQTLALMNPDATLQPPVRRRLTQALGRAGGLSLLPALALALAQSPAVAQDLIATELSLDIASFADAAGGLSLSLPADSPALRQRLFNPRLGDWVSGRVQLTLNYVNEVAVLDPGVASPPAEDRFLLRLNSVVQASGALLSGGAQTLNTGSRVYCRSGLLRCNEEPVGFSRALLLDVQMPGTQAALIQGLQLRLDTQLEILQPGLVVNSAQAGFSGRLLLGGQYQAKSMSAYTADALAATAAQPVADTAARLRLAAQDIAQLRAQDYGVAQAFHPLSSQAVARQPALREAGQWLAGAAEVAALRQVLQTPGSTSFQAEHEAAALAWNFAALVRPELGRVAGFSSAQKQSPALDLAALRGLVEAQDDAALLARLEAAQALEAGGLGDASAALWSFEGAVLGLDGARISVYASPQSFSGSGSFELALGAAQRHTLLRQGYNFDRVSLLAGGPAQGVLLMADGFGSGTLRLGDELYLGESYSGLLSLETGGQAARIALNNFYGPQLMLVASWGVAAVPEPASAVLLLAGLLLLRLKRRRA